MGGRNRPGFKSSQTPAALYTMDVLGAGYRATGYAVIRVDAVGAIFFQYPAGWLADRVDRGWLLVGCVAVATAAMAIFPWLLPGAAGPWWSPAALALWSEVSEIQTPQRDVRGRVRQRRHHLLLAAAKRRLGQLRGPLPVAFDQGVDQLVVKVVELVLPVLKRQPQVDDPLVLLHETDDQVGKDAGCRSTARRIGETPGWPGGTPTRWPCRPGEYGACAASFSARSRAPSTFPAASRTAVTSSTSRSWNISCTSRRVTADTALPCRPRETTSPSWRRRIIALRIGALPRP